MISYAQNFEDVMLWRALKHVEKGNYIDIGAQDPIIDSVSLAFHELGWRGIHVEPTPHYAELLRQQRQGDTIVQAAVSTEPGIITFFEIPDTGISTADAGIAQQHRERGFEVREIAVVSTTLAAIFASCSGQDIHWLKIDVEGFEQQVLASWEFSAVRPWIVVVESTLPLTQIETHESWESILVGYGYVQVYFDGLNRYYISNLHPELQQAFLAPPNVFDGFSLNGTASNPIHHLIVARHKQLISEIVAQNEQHKLTAANEIERLTLNLAALDKTHAEHEQNRMQHEQEVAAQMQAIQQQANTEKYEISQQHHEVVADMQRQHAEQERFAAERIQHLNNILQQLQADTIAREQHHAEKAAALQAELSGLLRAQVQREQDFSTQMQAVQQQANAEKYEISQQHQEIVADMQRQHAEHEQFAAERIQHLNNILQQLQADAVAREQHHAEKAAALQAELAELLRAQVQREQDFSAQQQAIQQQADQEKAEQAHHHDEKIHTLQHEYAEREQALNQQLQAGQQQLHDLEQAREDMQHKLNAQLQAERDVGQELQQVLAVLQDELAAMRNALSWRLTAPLRAAVGWFKPAPAQTGHAISAAEQPVVATPLPIDSYQMTSDIQELTTSHSLPETTNMTNNHPAQATQPTPSSTATNLNTLLQYQDRQFVEFSYMTLLKRPVDPEGLNYYLGRLRAGVPKIQILGQIIDSREAQTKNIELPGLRSAVKLHKLAQLPLVNSILKFFISVEGNSAFENRLRALEQQIFLFEKQSDARLDRIDQCVNSVQQLIVQQGQQLLASLQQSLATIAPVVSVSEPTAQTIQSDASGDFSNTPAMEGHDLINKENASHHYLGDERFVVGCIAYDRRKLLSSALAAIKQWPLGKRINE